MVGTKEGQKTLVYLFHCSIQNNARGVVIKNINSVIIYCISVLVADTTTDLIMSITATIKLLIFNFI